MANYIVMWEIDVDDADDPVDATWNAVNLLEQSGTVREQVYKLIDKDTKKEYKVDLYDIDIHAIEVIPGTYTAINKEEDEIN